MPTSEGKMTKQEEDVVLALLRRGAAKWELGEAVGVVGSRNMMARVGSVLIKQLIDSGHEVSWKFGGPSGQRYQLGSNPWIEAKRTFNQEKCQLIVAKHVPVGRKKK